jgi:DNA-binding transcriptional ArsR family regulator
MMSGDLVDVTWDALIGPLVHPTKVSIIEAMLWIDRPISARELERVFEERPGLSMSAVSYHMTSLATLGVLTLVEKRRVRGAWQKFYFFVGTDAD